MSEYGAETLVGLHLAPEFVFSEEFQLKLMSKHFQAFDKLRSEGFFIGEFIYNYADFNTPQSKYIRISINDFGIISFLHIKISIELVAAKKEFSVEIVSQKKQLIYYEGVILI